MRSPVTVLFVDDDSAILRAIRRSLRDSPFDVLFANSGDEAIGILETRHVDVVVSDLDMPRMSGLDLLRTVRDRWPITLRMVLTGPADFATTVAAINDCGIVRFFPKMFDPGTFVQALVQLAPRIEANRSEDELVALATERDRRLRAIEERFPGCLDVERDGADRVVIDLPARLAAASNAGSTAGAVLLSDPAR